MKVKILYIGSEVIICEIVEETEETIKVRKPLMAMTNFANRSIMLTTPPWVLLAKSDEFQFTLAKNKIIAIFDADSNAESAYIKETSGIEIPSPKAAKSLLI